MAKLTSSCRNCHSPMTGEYCSRCGQREGRGDLSFSTVAGEMVEEVVSWDSRLWRTLLPLLFRPGFLTAEFIAGRRARYVPPFRLYLIISFVLFLAMSLVAGSTDFISINKEPNETAEGVVIAMDSPMESDEDNPQWLKDLEPRLAENAEKLARDPGALISQLIEYLPQLMLLLLPIFALLLKAGYLFSPFHYLQHLVFALHFHSFSYLLYLFGLVAHAVFEAQGIGKFLFLLLVLYLPMALMRTYGSSVIGAVGKAVAILLIDSLLLLVAFSLITIVVVATM